MPERLWRMFCSLLIPYAILAMIGAKDWEGKATSSALLLFALNERFPPRKDNP